MVVPPTTAFVLLLSLGGRGLFNNGLQAAGFSAAAAAGVSAFQLPVAHRWRGGAGPAGRPNTAALAAAPVVAGSFRGSHPACDSAASSSVVADRLPPFFNSNLLLTPNSNVVSGGRSRHCSALSGSKLANAIFRSGSSAAGASAGSKAQHSYSSSQGVVVLSVLQSVGEALKPLLGYLLVVLRSMAPSPLEAKMLVRLLVAAMVGMFIGTERRTSHRPAGVRTM